MAAGRRLALSRRRREEPDLSPDDVEPVTIRREPITSPIATELIRSLNAELSATYPEPGATHFRLGEDEVAGGRGAFLIAYAGTHPVACGAVRRLDAATAELKRMYVIPDRRGTGLGRVLLAALEAEAARLGAERLVLETGTRQSAAISLYETSGFIRIPPFGEYCLSPDTSICMEKRL